MDPVIKAILDKLQEEICSIKPHRQVHDPDANYLSDYQIGVVVGLHRASTIIEQTRKQLCPEQSAPA